MKYAIRWTPIVVMWIFAIVLVLLGSRPNSANRQGPKPWQVWQKDYPCSGRTDWVSVATENPGGRAGLAYFEVFPGSHEWPTMSQALAEAAVLRMSTRFSQYCCHDWDIYRDDNTGKLSIVDGSLPPRVPQGYRLIKPRLCCEEAYSYVGFPNANQCGAGNKTYGCGGLGEKWNEEEAGWKSVWLRRGNSDVFDTSYTGPAGQRATTVNQVTVSGDLISVKRISSSDNNLCSYSGVITSNGMAVQGSYTCPRVEARPWRADITCAAATPKTPAPRPSPPGPAPAPGPGSDIDFSGSWMASEPRVFCSKYKLTLSRVGTKEWQGTLNINNEDCHYRGVDDKDHVYPNETHNIKLVQGQFSGTAEIFQDGQDTGNQVTYRKEVDSLSWQGGLSFKRQ